MTGGLIWLPEATGGTGPARRAQKANGAGNAVLADRNRLEKAATEKLLAQLSTLKQSLQKRLLADALTDFKRFNLQQLAADVDRLIVEATAALATHAEGSYANAASLGVDAVHEPIKATGLTIQAGLPGMDSTLVSAAFGNTVDLLTPPMQQFATNVKQAMRGVALAGDGRQEAITKLRDQIQGQGFDNAAYRAERIIRTELGRTFNTATYDRMVALSKEFPFLKKGWRANRDGRVRQGHREAGVKYQRGQGTIPVGQHFAVNAYDERPGKTPKLLGQVLLRFPVDPLATPQGRLSAAATIMCRCNGFVDFDLAQFGSHIQGNPGAISMGGNTVPAVPSGADPKPKLQQKPVRLPRPKGVKAEPKVKVPTPAQVTPKPATYVPNGPPVSSGMRLAAGYDKVKAALDLMDQVHGTGDVTLPAIPTGPLPSRGPARKAAAGYAHNSRGEAVYLGFSKKILGSSPFMATFHEVGHFLDHQGVGRTIFQQNGPNGAKGFGTDLARERGAVAAAMAKLQAAMKNSQALQTMKTWHEANLPPVDFKGNPQNLGGHTNGDGTVPLGTSRPVITYLLSTHETFARAYAQWMARKTGNPAALRELRNMQESSATALGPVPRTAPFNPNLVGAKKPKPGTWDYAWQWQDEDFRPIEQAMDELMEALGWRKQNP